MATDQYEVREHHQGFWKSIAELAYDVVRSDEVVVASATVDTSYSVKLHLADRELEAEKFGLGPIDTRFGSYVISERGVKRYLVASNPTARESLMSDEERGYPCFVSVSVGDVRRLTPVDGSTPLVSVHPAWRDSELSRHVVGSFEFIVPSQEDLKPLLVLAATVEALRTHSIRGTVVNQFGSI